MKVKVGIEKVPPEHPKHRQVMEEVGGAMDELLRSRKIERFGRRFRRLAEKYPHVHGALMHFMIGWIGAQLMAVEHPRARKLSDEQAWFLANHSIIAGERTYSPFPHGNHESVGEQIKALVLKRMSDQAKGLTVQ